MRKLRPIEQVDFWSNDVTRIIERMQQLFDAGDGWINLVPKFVEDAEDQPTSLGFLTLFGGGSLPVTMSTWIPASHDGAGNELSSLGITHRNGHRAVAALKEMAVEVPQSWIVEQDHPRRGLVLRLPSDAPLDEVLSWILRAVDALCAPQQILEWRADVHLPIAP